MTSGMVKWCSATKGFGFISPERVAFAVEAGEKGPKAAKARPA